MYIEFPQIGSHISAGEQCAVIESVKAASDLYCPIAGEVISVNTGIEDSPESINDEPYASWLFTIHATSNEELENLMSEDQYQEFIDA